MPSSGVLVDVDGTLVDSNYHHTIAWSRALREHGHDAPLCSIHRLIGMGGSELLDELIGRTDDDIEAAWRRHFDELLPEVHVLDGAADLLHRLHDSGLTVVLATSSPTDLLDAMRSKIGADDAIDLVVSSGDVESAKPEPDVFSVALDKADLPPGRVLVIGDAVWDVEAARRAGLETVAVETGGFSAAELRDAGASAVYGGPDALADKLGESPIARLI